MQELRMQKLGSPKKIQEHSASGPLRAPFFHLPSRSSDPSSYSASISTSTSVKGSTTTLRPCHCRRPVAPSSLAISKARVGAIRKLDGSEETPNFSKISFETTPF